MFGSLRLGKFFGIDTYVHGTFWLLPLFVFVSGAAAGNPAGAVGEVLFLFALFGCVALHEVGHALAARYYGVRTRDITLYPMGGVASLERMPEKPGQEIVIALAGPAVNVVIAAGIFAGMLAGVVAFPGSWDLTASDPLDGSVVRLMAVNVGLVVFNLIPAFPMDGGRVLRALLAIRMGHVRATQIAASIGQMFAFVLGFVGLFGNPLLIFIAIFVYLAAASEAQWVTVRAMWRDVPVSAAMITQFATLTPDSTVDEAIETLLRTTQSEFPVVDPEGKPIGLLSRSDLIRALKTVGPDARVADATTTPLPVIGHRRPLDDAFRILQEKSAPAVGVIDSQGKLTGVITSETIGEMIMVSDAMPEGAQFGPWSRPARA